MISNMHYKSTVSFEMKFMLALNCFDCIQIGVDFALKVIPWDGKTEVRLQLWDIAGICGKGERKGVTQRLSLFFLFVFVSFLY